MSGLRPARAAVITVSDRCSRGEAVDETGPALVAELVAAGFDAELSAVVPDHRLRIQAALAAELGSARLVVTAGGTGLGPRDVTPQTVLPLLDYEVPGLAEEMRRAGRESTPLAVLSRSLAGISGQALVLCLPGSPRGAVESLRAVLPVLPHALRLLEGDTEH